MEELNRAYDALKKAHDAGDVEGAQRIAEYARSLELQQQKAPEAEAPTETPATMSVMGIEAPLAPMAGAVIGSSVGALASPAVSGAVDTAAVRAAQSVAPGSKVIPGDVTPQAVKNWLATQTSQPYAGGDTMSKAHMKAKIAAGEPIQSRGSNVPIRKGNLGISNQPPPPTLAQQTATNLLNAEKVKAPGIARRVAGMGAMGAQTGNAISEIDKGNPGAATLSALGAMAAAASQSRIKPIRALGTIGSIAIPGVQMMMPEEPVPEMAAGGSVANVGSQMGMNVPFMGQELKNVGQAMAQRQYPEAALQSGSLAYSALAPINPLTATLSALGYSPEVGDATLEGYKKQQEQAAKDREFEAYKRQQALQKKQKDDAFIQRFQAARPQKFDIGGKVKTAKKLLEGNFLKNYLPHTAKNQNPEVGSRFETEDLGGLLPVTPVSMESIRGKMVGTIPWDNSSRNVKINSVSGIPLTESQITHGGQGWVRDIEHNAANIGGANAKGAATAIQNKINAASELGEKLGGSGEVVLSPGTGAKFSDNFSVPVFNVYKDLYDQADLPRTILQKHSDFLRNVPKTNPKTKEVSYPFSNAPDINSPEMKEFALQNPNFRKQFLMEMQKPRSEKLLGYNTDDIYNAMTDPNLRDVPAGYMGHTLINVKKDAPVTPSSNSTYAYNMFGNYGGSLEHTPNEVFLNKAYNDNFNILRQKYPNAPEKKIHDMALGALDKRGEGVFELMNDEAINRIGQYHEGLKQGKFDPSDYKNALDYLKTPGVYAEGGEVEGYQAGGFAKLAKHAHSQHPKVAQALEEYLKGNISQADRIKIVNELLPIRKRGALPPEYTDEQIVNALLANKQSKALAEVPAGMRVGNRLDIPAYTQHGVYVDTTHDLSKGNAPISYNRTGHLKDVEFSSKPNQAVRVGLGTKEQALTPMGAEIGAAKSPFALIKGTNVGTKDEEVRRMMAEMLNDPSYVQIGMDPRRGSQFFNKETGMPVFAAEEKLQSGPLVIVPRRGLEETSLDDPRLDLTDFPGKKYKKGGLATLKKKKK
jgi:hypothetical protein